MLLPTKTQIQSAKSKERQLDIDQGLSFARKVDELRASKEKEEIGLAKFRKDSMDSLQKEIYLFMDRKDVLIQEVKVLEDRKTEALKPLIEEWAKMKTVKDAMDIKEKEMSNSLVSIQAKERDLSIKQVQAHAFIEQTKIALDNTKKTELESLSKQEETITGLKNLMSYRERVESEMVAKKKELDRREFSLGAREYNISIREKNQDERNLELNKKETLVRDRYATLERNIKRL